MKDKDSLILENLYESISLIGEFKNKIHGDYPHFIEFLSQHARDEEIQKYLNSGVGESDIVTYKEGLIRAGDCTPTQHENGVQSSLAWPLGKRVQNFIDVFIHKDDGVEVIGKPVNIYSVGGKNYILNGHHIWSSVYLIDPDANLKVTYVIPKVKVSPIDILKALQMGIAALNKTIPFDVMKGEDLYKVDLNQLHEILMGIVSDEAVEAAIKYNFASSKEEMVKNIIQNVIRMRRENNHIENAPHRAVMPQTDKVNFEEFSSLTSQGKLRIISPFIG